MYALEICKLYKVYKNGVKALNGIDLNIMQGDFFALIGPNGAGKSSLINIVASLCNKSSGQVRICGFDIDKQTLNAKRILGIVPQELNFNILETPYEIVVNQARFYGVSWRQARHQAKQLLKQLDLWDKHREISKSLSGGMKRRLMMARALVHSPHLLLLDEPTVGVDVEQRRAMWEFLRKINHEGMTIILTTHYLEEAENLCRNVALILNGKIMRHSSMAELITQYQQERILIALSDIIVELPYIPGVELKIIDTYTL